ncbi:uncharacterized protein LOC128852667 isoform X1 [Cuculus canorus]|uniref:uncharacterized protein LOC128852667 isoform X1 n=1 Tax=Cuculus canorus TaxID=55661 RepID=UPI0023AB41DD|nr:uncharacterized protein LOC128852667 isoform X1 [Cuculus canorus]
MGQPPLLWAPWARASPPAQESISPSDLISISPLSASNRPSLPIPALPDTMFSFEVGRGLFSPRRLADGDKHHIPAPLSHCSQTELEPRAAPPSAPLRDAARARCEGRTDGRRDGWMDGCLHPLPGHGARRQGTAAPTGDGDKRDQGRTEHNEESDGGWGRGRRRATRGQKKGRSFLFSRLNNPISLSLSSDGRCSSPWIIFVASSGPVPTAPYPYAGDPRTGRSVPGGVSAERSRGAGSPGHAARDAARDVGGVWAVRALLCRAALHPIIPSPPTVCWNQGLHRSRRWAQLYLTRFTQPPFSSLSRSLRIRARPSGGATAPLSPVPSVSVTAEGPSDSGGASADPEGP